MDSPLSTDDPLQALYIALPVILFFLIVVAVLFCYWKRLLCFPRAQEEALLSTASKNRFTVDLGRKSRRESFFASETSSIEKSSLDQLSHSGDVRLGTYIASPYAYPDITHTVPVGQATHKSRLTTPNKAQTQHTRSYPASPSPHKKTESFSGQYNPTQLRNDLSKQSLPRLKIQNQDTLPAEDIPDLASAKTTPSRTATPTVSIKTFPGPSSSGQSTQQGLLLNFESDYTSSSEQNNLNSSKSRIDRLSPNTCLSPKPRTEPNTEDMFRAMTDDVTQRRPSFDLQMFHKALQSSTGLSHSVNTKRNSMPDAENNIRRGSENSNCSTDLSPSLQAGPIYTSRETVSGNSRRRSSMQMPIDLNQIDPRLYKTSRLPSMDSEPDEETAMIHFTLEYNKDLEVLTVKLIQARNLPIQDFSGTTDPYCTVTLTPGFTSRRSKVHRRTSHPEFEESFVFSINPNNLQETALEVKSFHFDQFSRDECNGTMEVNLQEIDFVMTPSVDLWRKFRPTMNTECSDSDICCGDLLMALSYLRSAEKLTVVVQKARNLHLPESKRSLPDSYVKVCLYKGKQRLKKKKTTIVNATCNPVFNQALTFNVPCETLQEPDVKLVCYVVHDLKLGYNLDLGQLELGQNCDDNEARGHWQEMMSQSPSKPIARWHHLKTSQSSISSSSAGDPTNDHESIPSYARRKSLAVLESLRPNSNPHSHRRGSASYNN